MAGFSELIKNFDKTRDYVRDFFIYGCKVRSDFNRKSSRTYDDEKRRVESWMDGYIRYDDSVRGRQVSISVDSGIFRKIRCITPITPEVSRIMIYVSTSCSPTFSRTDRSEP